MNLWNYVKLAALSGAGIGLTLAGASALLDAEWEWGIASVLIGLLAILGAFALAEELDKHNGA